MEEIHSMSCRICLKDEGTLRNFFDEEIGDKPVINLMEEFFGINVHPPDSENYIRSLLPHNICEKCFSRLQIVVELKDLAWSSHQRIEDIEQALVASALKEDVEAVETISSDSLEEDPEEVLVEETNRDSPTICKPYTDVDLLKARTVKRTLACPHCPKMFSCRQSLCNHKRLYHNEIVGDYKCDVCGRYFASRAMIDRHAQTHEPNTFTCKICGNAFSLESILKRHMHKHKKEQKGEFECADCGKMYKYKNNLLFNHDCEKKRTHDDANSEKAPRKKLRK